MFSRYVVTGAAGHVGNATIRELVRQGREVVGLVLPGEKVYNSGRVRYVAGDVREPSSLDALFEGHDPADTAVIHTAGIVRLSGRDDGLMRSVNVDGTKNVIECCRRLGAGRLVYVSSVHAIPETRAGGIVGETSAFSPKLVKGAYAKTKAEATCAVLDAVQGGLNAVVVHPTGIIGPYNGEGNHLVQLVRDYIAGRIPACVKGGYDFVDVRDIAIGCIAAAENGRQGSCYILSNSYCEIKDILAMVRKEAGGRKLPVLPLWLARAVAPFFEMHAKVNRIRPLYTAYSLHTLSGKDRFTHKRASDDLGYRPRDLRETVRDTVAWIKGSDLRV